MLKKIIVIIVIIIINCLISIITIYSLKNPVQNATGILLTFENYKLSQKERLVGISISLS